MLRRLWQESLIFRRSVAILSFVLASLAGSVASHWPRTAALPNDQVNKLAVAGTNEEFRIYKPRINAGDAALSLEGSPGVSVEVWAQEASLTGTSAELFGNLAPGTTRAVYAASDTIQASAKDCRSAVTIRRAQGSLAPQQLRLWQRGTGQDDQRFRQVIVASPETAMMVNVSTDTMERGQSCSRVLRMGNKAIAMPHGPVDLLVPANQQITLIFSSSDPDQILWQQKRDTFDGLSLGDGDLNADSIDVVSTAIEKTPLLHVVSHRGTNGVTLHDLKLGAEQAQLSVGEDGEKADAWQSGQRFPTLDLPQKAKDNVFWAAVLGSGFVGTIWKWIQVAWWLPKPKRTEATEVSD